MATLKDVAKLACVDVSTVSRALNNTSYVHPDTKARILAAVKELSYQPNVLAKGLRQGKRHTIGIVVPRLSMTVFAELIQGIDEEARYHGYSILVCTTEDDPDVERMSESIEKWICRRHHYRRNRKMRTPDPGYPRQRDFCRTDHPKAGIPFKQCDR